MAEIGKPLNLIESLLAPARPFPQEYLHIFSDITEADLAEIKKVWPRVPILNKINLIRDLEAMMEADTLLSCDDFARFALTDENVDVRCHAIGLLWESEDPKLAAIFGDLLAKDASDAVRANAADALGRFVLLGELEEISQRVFDRTVTLLMNHYKSDLPDEIRLQILRSLSYCGNEEIADQIRAAYASAKKAWKVAALEAMGRSADTRWKEQVLESLDSPDADIQYEAVRSAGELSLKSARLTLLAMLVEEDTSEDLRMQLIWSLSKIGGESVRETLQALLDQSDDDEEIDILEMALDNLEFTEDESSLDLF